MTTPVRAIDANGRDIGTWDMTAIPREDELVVANGNQVCEVIMVMWWPEAAGGTAVTLQIRDTGKRI